MNAQNVMRNTLLTVVEECARMMLVKVKLVYPFRLALEEGAYQVRLADRTYTIRPVSRRGKRTAVYHEEASPEGAKQEWYRAVPTKPGGEERQPSRELCFNDDPERFLETVTDFVGYTVLDVLFEIEDSNLADDEEPIKGIEREALGAAQHFVDIYRLSTNEPDVFRPSEEDSPGVEIFVAESYTRTVAGDIEAKLRRVYRRVRWESPRATGHTKKMLAGPGLAEFLRKISQGDEVPLHMQLLLDARTVSQVEKSHAAAVVLVETGFEAFLQFQILKECTARGILQLPVGRGKATVEKVCSDAVVAGNVRDDLLGSHFKMLCGGSVKDNEKYQRWLDETYRPRNDIVHSGANVSSEATVKMAFEAAIDYMNYLLRRLSEASD